MHVTRITILKFGRCSIYCWSIDYHFMTWCTKTAPAEPQGLKYLNQFIINQNLTIEMLQSRLIHKIYVEI